MRMTEFGMQIATEEAEKKPAPMFVGASGHCGAIAYDVGSNIVVTGYKIPPRRVGSVVAAWALMRAAYRYDNAWLVTDNGRRRIIQR